MSKTVLPTVPHAKYRITVHRTDALYRGLNAVRLLLIGLFVLSLLAGMFFLVYLGYNLIDVETTNTYIREQPRHVIAP